VGSVGVVDPQGAPDRYDARKVALRDQLVTARGRRSLLELSEAARDLAAHLLETPEVRRAATVAAYVSVGTEPGTGPLLDALRERGRRVIVPVVLPDLDLDWAVYDGPLDLVRARRGLLEPTGRRLGVDAVGTADVVVTPGLAVDRTGMRLGQGGGCYDRALGRVPVGTFTATLLFDGELLDTVPTEAHDRPVTAVVTPSGVTRLRRG
jgi:5-formyltetrahydrofolate cyclo-ligase